MAILWVLMLFQANIGLQYGYLSIYSPQRYKYTALEQNSHINNVKFVNIFMSTPRRFHQLHATIKTVPLTHRPDPIESLNTGRWVKLICGASNQDLPLIRNLCYVYTLAGVDCIDMCADPAVVSAANSGVEKAMLDYGIVQKPLLMISVNDDEDPHFRKASFNPDLCPSDCSRPCERICPALAIPSIQQLKDSNEGVIQEKCYGCGRCLTICPIENIKAKSYKVGEDTIDSLFQSNLVSAIEIHTQPSHQMHFYNLWTKVSKVVTSPAAKVIAVSFPDMGNNTLEYINSLQNIMTSCEEYRDYKGIHIWQADGRPMSGDIGRGTTHATCSLALSLLSRASESSGYINFMSKRHFVQLAGGANDYSSTLSSELELSSMEGFGGYGFGGFARKHIFKYLTNLEADSPGALIEDFEEVLSPCLEFAQHVVNSVKGF